MTGKLATLTGFIKGTKNLSASFSKQKGKKATEVATEATDDPEKEMKTFFFSSDQDSQDNSSWLPGLVIFFSHLKSEFMQKFSTTLVL